MIGRRTKVWVDTSYTNIKNKNKNMVVRKGKPDKFQKKSNVSKMFRSVTRKVNRIFKHQKILKVLRKIHRCQTRKEISVIKKNNACKVDTCQKISNI